MKLSRYNQFIKESKEDIDSLLKNYDISNYTINSDGSVDINGNAYLRTSNLTKLPVKFRNISLDFSCSGNQLTSMDGCPQSVGDELDCSYNKLTSLKGCPQSVGGSFNCSTNELTSLDGCPQSVGGNFYCQNNYLTSLEGCPQGVGGDVFVCRNNQITNFKGFPEYFEGHFYFTGNPVHEILLLFGYNKKSIYWINEHDVIQGNKVIYNRLEEVAYELKMELPENIKFDNYEII